MLQTIFDIDQPATTNQMVTYDLVPSQHLVNIRSVIASRKRKSCSSSVSPSAVLDTKTPPKNKDNSKSNKRNRKQKQMVFDDMISGLPSPPVESPMAEFPSIMTPSNTDQSPPSTPGLTFTPCSSSVVSSTSDKSPTTKEPQQEEKCAGLTTEEIKSKLAKLREEKHNLFQLMKRLVEQEEQQKQQDQQKHQLEKQQQAKKKKASRWSTYQQPTPLPSPSLRYTPTAASRPPLNASRPLSSYTQMRTQTGYFGSSQRSHQPPFLY
jgi:hypothetical protein